MNTPLTFENPVSSTSYLSTADIYYGLALVTSPFRLITFEPKRFEQEIYAQYNQKLTGTQLVNEFPAFHEKQWFITALKKLHLLLSCQIYPVHTTIPLLKDPF